MSAHGKVGNIQKAADILLRMETNEDVQPITFDYNILLGAYARSGQAGEAEKLMQRMVGRCKDKEKDEGGKGYCDCAPDNVSYNLLLDAHAKSGEANA
jgi:pentatricopeptide repeat protein